MVEEDRSSGQYDLEDRLIDFSVRIVDLVEGLPDTRVGNHLANQLVRCGTSAAPNHGEAQSAECRNDFIHEMKVALKEPRETRIWLRVTQRRVPSKLRPDVDALLAECDELISIFAASIRTAQRNRRD